MTGSRAVGLGLVATFLVAHLALLPHTLEDLDSINFALGVRQFDVAKHQPHPPGYPVYIAAAKASTATLRALGVDSPSPRGLAIWSALAGAAALPALVLFFRRLVSDDDAAAAHPRADLAWWTAFVVAASPIYWFNALRPLSDMLGLAAAIWALALAAAGPSDRRFVAAAGLAGLAIGIRSQTAVLTLPFLALTLVRRRDVRAMIGAAGAFAAGVLIWGVPLIVASGGPGAYLHALSAQAGEDFSGVEMLWTSHSARAAAHALVNTFVSPWDWRLGIVICVLAAIGAARLLWRAPKLAGMLLVTFAPYAIFHLLFQETVTTRYALPLVPVVAFAALAAVEGLPAGGMQALGIGIAVISLWQAVPASIVYAHDGAPVFRAFDDMATTAHGAGRVDAIAMHAEMRRASQWAAAILPARVVTATHGHEVEALVALWRAEPGAQVWFVADPDRSDLAAFDAHALDLARAYRWGFVEPPFVGGARPGNADWYRMAPPGWMLDRGWALTAEIGGQTARNHLGPHVAPAIAWLKRRPDALTVVLGGRNLGAAGSAPATVNVTLKGERFTAFGAPPGFFVRELEIPSSALAQGAEYLPFAVSSTAGPVSLEQFDAQPAGVPMLAYHAGWNEPEYNRDLGRAWRWMTEKADLWVRPVGRAVTLHLEGESPLKYFKSAPHVKISVAGREVAAFDPASDFDQTITLPADLLQQAGGHVILESSEMFVPGGDGGGGDQRHLALRMYRVSVD